MTRRIGKRIYLDYAASTPVDARVLGAMAPYWRERYGNAGALHSFGQEAMAALDAAREVILRALGVGPESFRDLIFTASATEANNLVLRGIVGAWWNRAFLKNRAFARSSDKQRAALSSRRVALGDTKPVGTPRAFFERRDSTLVPKLIVSAVEHESVLETARDLEREGLVTVTYLPVDRVGCVKADALKSLLDDRTLLVSVMYVNNEIGTVQPIAEIAKIVRNFRNSKSQIPNPKQISNPNNQNPKHWNLELGAWNLPAVYPLVHTDAVQAFAYYDCRPDELGVDFMTLSAHKIGGPKGVGALFVKNRELRIMNHEGEKPTIQDSRFMLQPIITGGGQEFGLRSGTENVPGIVGFAEAVRIAVALREKERRRLFKLKRFFWKGLREIFPSVANGPQGFPLSQSSPHILNVAFPGVSAEEFLIALDRAGIAVGSGSACSARRARPSHVLLGLGLDEERSRSSIRFSFGRTTTKSELQKALRRMKRVLQKKAG